MEQNIFLPTMSHWEHKNPWTGSLGKMRFTITVENDMLHTCLWYGENILALSEVAFEQDFPVSEEGLLQLRAFLDEHSKQVL